MSKAIQAIRWSRESGAALFAILFSAAFILAQFAAGFQLALFLSAMAIGVVLTLWFPRAGLFAIVALTVLFERFYTLQPFIIGRLSYKLYPVDVFLIAVFVSVLLQLLFRRTRMHFRFADGAFALFLVFVTLEFSREFFSTDDNGGSMSTAFSTWKNYFFYGLIYFSVPLLLRREEYLLRFTRFFLGASVVATVFVLIGIVSGGGLWTEYTPLSTDGIRILALPHAYYFSMALIAVLLSWGFVARLRKEGSLGAAVIFASVPLWIVGIVGSLMRHLWIGLAFSFIVMWFVLPRERRQSLAGLMKSSLAAVLVVGALLAYGVALFPHSDANESVSRVGYVVSERLVSLGDSNDTSISWRNTVWREALGLFSNNVLLGTGFGAKVAVEIDAYREFVEIRNVHNSWLALLVQTGLIGFGLMTAFLIDLVLRLRRSVFRSGFLDAAKYATLGILVFQSMVFLYQPYLETNLLGLFFWINLGVMRTLVTLDERQ